MEAALILILGAVAPFLVAIINRVQWSSTTKQLVVWGASIVLGAVWIALTGGFGAGLNFESFVTAVPIIYALSQVVYEFLFKNVLQKLEVVTDKSAVVVSPAETAGNILITSNETIAVAKSEDVSPHVEVDTPVEVTRTDEDPHEPRG